MGFCWQETHTGWNRIYYYIEFECILILFALIQIVFLLGNPGNLTTQRQVDEEHKLHGDIVQEEFDETYRNITVKNIMGLKWASKYCSHAAYVVKCDDDMFVNTKLLISTVINSSENSKMPYFRKLSLIVKFTSKIFTNRTTAKTSYTLQNSFFQKRPEGR